MTAQADTPGRGVSSTIACPESTTTVDNDPTSAMDSESSMQTQEAQQRSQSLSGADTETNVLVATAFVLLYDLLGIKGGKYSTAHQTVCLQQ